MEELKCTYVNEEETLTSYRAALGKGRVDSPVSNTSLQASGDLLLEDMVSDSSSLQSITTRSSNEETPSSYLITLRDSRLTHPAPCMHVRLPGKACGSCGGPLVRSTSKSGSLDILFEPSTCVKVDFLTAVLLDHVQTFLCNPAYYSLCHISTYSRNVFADHFRTTMQLGATVCYLF
jgi:hypothetical protein